MIFPRIRHFRTAWPDSDLFNRIVKTLPIYYWIFLPRLDSSIPGLTFTVESYINETRFFWYQHQQEGGKRETTTYGFTFGLTALFYS